ncbi:glycosyl transferase family 51, partial [bacterium]|nr:glycosyl transferase family 51 [bacterium]
MAVWRRRRRLVAALVLLAGAGAAVYLGGEEIRTSRLQARVLHWFAGGMTFELRDGPNPDAVYPTDGPFDERLGYTRIPQFLAALTADGYAVEMQAAASPRLGGFMRGGGFPIYHEKAQAGFTLLDRSGVALHARRYPERVFAAFDDIPPPIRQTLLFIENRELLDTKYPY